MNPIERDIENFRPQKGRLAIYWLGGAGFIIKSPTTTIGIDLYLSDAVRNGEEYKRLVPAPVAPENLALDVLIASHEHGDHTDTASARALVRPLTLMLGPDSALDVAYGCGVPRERTRALNRGDVYQTAAFCIRAVKADHGTLSPQAIGVMIDIEGKTIYFTGDTCFRADYCDMIGFKGKVDLLMVPINSSYGNPGPDGAAYIAACVDAGTILPCHYWLFREHGGDPGAFLDSCARIVPGADARVLAMGERFVL